LIVEAVAFAVVLNRADPAAIPPLKIAALPVLPNTPAGELPDALALDNKCPSLSKHSIIV
jgi:hypothetical protein